MRLQSLAVSAWGLVSRAFMRLALRVVRHPLRTAFFLFRWFVVFVLVSLLSTVFVFSYAASDYVPADTVHDDVFYIFPNRTGVFYAFPPTYTFWQSCSALGGHQDTVWGVVSCVFTGSSTSFAPSSWSPRRCPNSVPYPEFSPVCTGVKYICPPSSYPDYEVGPIPVNGQQMCARRTCKSKNNWFSNDMEVGYGTACSVGCEYTVDASFVSATGSNAFIGTGTGNTCKCENALYCWKDGPKPDENPADDTCYAWDLGEVKGVDCGKNGSMTVDLQPINDSLNSQSQSIQQLQTDMKDAYAYSDSLAKQIDELKKMGCTVSPGADGVTVNCNGSTAVIKNGAQGDKGDKGEQGEQGIQGGVGAKGDTGDKGDQGEQGVAGIDGKDGAQGEKGDKGDQGEQGVAGVDGKDGAQGEKGDKGDQGEQGVAGADGKDGAQGIQGERGERGVQGEQGIAGVAGATGAAGADGLAGKDGEDGDSVTAVQDGNDVHIVSLRSGAVLATLKGIDRDGIIEAIDQSNEHLVGIKEVLTGITSGAVSVPELSEDFSEALPATDWESKNFKTVLTDHVDALKQTELFQSVGKYFAVSFSGDCSPINASFSLPLLGSFNISIDVFCTLTIWPYIRAIVLFVFGFFAFRIAVE